VKHGSNITWLRRYDHLLRFKDYFKGYSRSSIGEYLSKKAVKFLDIGCSVGIETSRLAAEHPETEFTGIDNNPENIKIAKSGSWKIPYDTIETNLGNLARLFKLFREEEGTYLKLDQPPSNLDFRVGDYNHIFDYFQPKTFNLITGFFCGLHYSKSLEQVVKLLKPEGILLTEGAEIRY